MVSYNFNALHCLLHQNDCHPFEFLATGSKPRASPCEENMQVITV